MQSSKCAESLQLLLNAKADIDGKSHLPFVDGYISDSIKFSLQIESKFFGDLALAHILEADGAVPPLRGAIMYNNAIYAQALLEAGADPTISGAGETMIEHARRRGRTGRAWQPFWRSAVS